MRGDEGNAMISRRMMKKWWMAGVVGLGLWAGVCATGQMEVEAHVGEEHGENWGKVKRKVEKI